MFGIRNEVPDCNSTCLTCLSDETMMLHPLTMLTSFVGEYLEETTTFTATEYCRYFLKPDFPFLYDSCLILFETK